MTGLKQATRAIESSAHNEVSAPTEPIPLVPPIDQESRSNPIEGRSGIGWLVGAGLGSVAIAWYILLSPGELGNKSQWFFGAVVFVVVMVTMWQTLNIQRHAKLEVAEAAERLQRELTAADQRAALELALTQKWHRAELESRQRLHRAEMEAQRELARIERAHLHEQLQRHAMIEVSRAVGAQTRMLATLWSEGARVLLNDDRDAREQAMNAIFEQISQVVNEVGVELDNAHLVIEDHRLHQALDQVNEAVLLGIRVAEEVHTEVIEGRTPQPNPIPAVARLLHERASEARRLAWALLRTGLTAGNA